MAFEWNQKKYDEIVDTVCAMPRPKSEPVYMINADKYKHLVRNVTEEYLVHPDGPFPGTKAEIKKNMEYRGKKLIKMTQEVTYYGDAIQAAIDECAKNGGGRVEVPAGEWFTGAIELKSHVELHLSKGATLAFIRNKTNEYYPVRFSRWEAAECMNFSPFVCAYDCEHISITGEGTLDGRADEFNWMPWKFGYFGETDQEEMRQKLFKMAEDGVDPKERVFDDKISPLRPPFIQFFNSKNVYLEGITIANSPFWEVNPVFCENFWAKGLKIVTDLYNNDGIDPDCCNNVLIEDCFFLTGDDCIAIKSGRNADGRKYKTPTQNVVIRNNKFANGHGGITIGSEISGGVHDVYANNNFFDSPNLDYPIRFKTNALRGGVLENVYVKHSVVNKSKLAVVHADFFYDEGHDGDYLPRLANITIDDFKTQKYGSIDSKNAFFLKGFEDAPIENIVFRDMVLDGVKGDAEMINVNNLTYENVTINGKKVEDKTINIGPDGKVR